MHTDDIIQIITSSSKSKLMVKAEFEEEIERKNKFDRKWKIKTSEKRFKIIPIAKYKEKKKSTEIK